MPDFDFPELKETEGKIADRRKQLSDIFAEAGPTIDLTKVKAYGGDKTAALAAIRTLNEELDDLATKRDEDREILKAARRYANIEEGDGNEPSTETDGRRTKSLGAQFTDSVAYKSRTRGGDSPLASIQLDLKTLMETTAGFAPESVRSGLIVDYATRPVQIADIIPTMPWDQEAYKYMEETTFTNNAAETAEGGTYGEAALVYTDKSVTVESITVWIPVTDLQLDSVPFIQARLNQRLPFMIRQRLDGQLAVGDGVSPNILGINNKVGINTQAKGADPVFDAILKGATKCRTVGFALPNAMIIEPTDWQDIRLTRTLDGIYILGNPTDPAPTRVWGLLPVEASAQTSGTAVVGDFANYSELLIRKDIDVKVSNSHSDFFIKGKQAIRADMRACVAWTRPSAFCTITGI